MNRREKGLARTGNARVAAHSSLARRKASEAAHVRAVGLRGRWRRRQESRCEGCCEAMLSAPWTALSPAPGNGHTHESTVTLRSMTKYRLASSD
jgi:hypothetical protein